MALYVDNKKVKINLNGIKYKINIPTIISTIPNGALLTSDNFILLDSNGYYLLSKEESE